MAPCSRLAHRLAPLPHRSTRLCGTPQVAGSQRCTLAELQNILSSVGEFHSKAGGSASNVGRALALGFGIGVQLVSLAVTGGCWGRQAAEG